MATWTDGAAYAPIERPDGFATPEVSPLEDAPALVADTPGAVDKPTTFTSAGTQVALEELQSTPPSSRDAREPFTVAGTLLTSSPGSGIGERDPKTPFETYNSSLDAPTLDEEALPPPVGPPLPVAPAIAHPPGQPGAPANQQAPWTGPPPPLYQTSRPSPSELDSATKTMLILAIGCFIMGMLLSVAAPYLMIVAGILAMRTKTHTGSIGLTSLIVGTALVALTSVNSELQALSGLACLGFTIWITIHLAGRRSRRR